MPANLIWYIVLLIWKLLKFHQIRPEKSKKRGKHISEHPSLIHSCGHFEGQPTLYDERFTIYGNSCNFVLVRPQKTKNSIFRALSVVWEVFISETTHSKSSLAIILRGQLTFYDHQFARYGFWTILGLLGPILAQKMGFAHLSAWSPNQS